MDLSGMALRAETALHRTVSRVWSMDRQIDGWQLDAGWRLHAGLFLVRDAVNLRVLGLDL